MTVNELDNRMYSDIVSTSKLSKELVSMGLITSYQHKMITKWLMTSTKKAVRILDKLDENIRSDI